MTSNTDQDMPHYRVGIIGAGFIGRVHAYGYLNLPLFYDPPPCRGRITHVCTGHRDTAEAAREQLQADVAATDYREISENPEIDIVHICTPNNLHRDQLLSAMAHQKHIYCDKPLTATLEEAEEVRAAAANYQGALQMTFQLRFFPATMRARQLIDEGVLGEILQFRVAFLHAGSADPTAPLKWKLSAAAGGGVIADLASHVLDLTTWLLGDITAIQATTQIAYPTRPTVDDPTKLVAVDAEDAVFCLARLADGAVGAIEATKLATGAEDEMRFEVHGSKGALRFNSMDPHHLEFYDAKTTDQPMGGRRGWTSIDTGQRYPKPGGFPAGKVNIGWIRCHLACLANFLTDLTNGAQGAPGLDQGVYVQQLMRACRDSAESGNWVEIERLPPCR